MKSAKRKREESSLRKLVHSWLALEKQARFKRYPNENQVEMSNSSGKRRANWPPRDEMGHSPAAAAAAAALFFSASSLSQIKRKIKEHRAREKSENLRGYRETLLLALARQILVFASLSPSALSRPRLTLGSILHPTRGDE